MPTALRTPLACAFALGIALVGGDLRAQGLPAVQGAAVATAVPQAVVATPQVRAELVAHAPEGVQAGKPLMLGLLIEHKKDWHTYWKNPGDSGLPTTLAWKLPAGFSAGDIQWPTPRRLPLGPLMNFGYEGQLLLPVAVQVPPAGSAGQTLSIQLRADWLVCKDVCIPEGGDFVLQLPTQAATAAHAAAFAKAAQASPQAAPGAQGQAEIKAGALQVSVGGLPAAWQGKAVQFFPELAGVLHNATPVKGQWDAGVWRATLAIDPQRSEGPKILPAVLTVEAQPAGLTVAVQVAGPWPPLAQAATAALPSLGNATVTSGAAEPSSAAAPDAAPPALGLALALLLALAGGALLNLMPCVFPVLSLKVVGFARHAQDRRQVFAGGLAYTAGVVLSFVALAALMIALRAGGEQVGWGFQLQSPAVVVTLALLFTLIGLNLAGVFEVGSLLPSSVAAARARHPLVDSALTGVLAVAVASPCTAPFMAASLGLALTLPTPEALAIFAALGLGMALPYLAASAWPRLARALPRPGAWMVHFKVLMAFPMFATVVWLAWVLGQQTGIDGVAALLGLLVVVAFTAWALGAPSLGPGARRGFAAAAVVLLAITLVWALPSWRQDAVAAPSAGGQGSAGTLRSTQADPLWQPWSPERVVQAQAEGRAVFVDFTAAWCVTCQFNKRTTLGHAEVRAAFERKRVLLLRADWTRRDATIGAELARLQRSGVPVYALYVPGATTPRLLSEILSVGEVTSALSALPG